MFKMFPGSKTNLSAKITSSIVKIPVFDYNTKSVSYDTNYKLMISIKMRSCIVGEAYIKSSGECYYCLSGTYSLKLLSEECKQCPNKGVNQCPGGNKI